MPCPQAAHPRPLSGMCPYGMEAAAAEASEFQQSKTRIHRVTAWPPKANGISDRTDGWRQHGGGASRNRNARVARCRAVYSILIDWASGSREGPYSFGLGTGGTLHELPFQESPVTAHEL